MIHDDLIGRLVQIGTFCIVVVCAYKDRSLGRDLGGYGYGSYGKHSQPEQEDTG
jgi:hypothetical protein